jgi:hypothetical protein
MIANRKLVKYSLQTLSLRAIAYVNFRQCISSKRMKQGVFMERRSINTPCFTLWVGATPEYAIALKFGNLTRKLRLSRKKGSVLAQKISKIPICSGCIISMSEPSPYPKRTGKYVIHA